MSTRTPHVLPSLPANASSSSPKHSPPRPSSKSRKHTSQSRKVVPTPDVSGGNDDEHKGRRGHTKAGKSSAGMNGTLPQHNSSEIKTSRSRGLAGGLSSKGSGHPHTKSGDLSVGVSRKGNVVKENSGDLHINSSISTKGKGSSLDNMKEPTMLREKSKNKKSSGTKYKDKSGHGELRRTTTCSSWILSQLGLHQETIYLKKSFAKEAATALNLQQWHLQKVPL